MHVLVLHSIIVVPALDTVVVIKDPSELPYSIPGMVVLDEVDDVIVGHDLLVLVIDDASTLDVVRACFVVPHLFLDLRSVSCAVGLGRH